MRLRMRSALMRLPDNVVKRTCHCVMALASMLASALYAAPSLPANSLSPTFAVLAGTLSVPFGETQTQRLFEGIEREGDIAFIVYTGGIKSATESCHDQLYEQRQTFLGKSRIPLILIPGQHDWSNCDTQQAGAYDPVERLDFMRQTIFADTVSLGQNPLPLIRESEIARFRPYRENVRWTQDDIIFIGLNAPSPNNRYLTAGGRNGEFEDRVIANAFWIDHAVEYAKRRHARALVIVIEGDPQFERQERTKHLTWFSFNRPRTRDGFHEFKQNLVKAALAFQQTILLIHPSATRLPTDFRIDHPLRGNKGEVINNLTRIAIAPHPHLLQWLRITVKSREQLSFQISVQTETPPSPPALHATPHHDTPLPPIPEISTLPALPESRPP